MYVDYVGSRTSGSRLCVLLSLHSLNTCHSTTFINCSSVGSHEICIYGGLK